MIASSEPSKRRKTQEPARLLDRLVRPSVRCFFGSDLLLERLFVASVVMDGKFAFAVA
jgi:hypothetical protein